MTDLAQYSIQRDFEEDELNLGATMYLIPDNPYIPAQVESVKPKVQPKDRFKTPYGKREVKKPLKIGSDLLSKLVPRKPARFS